MRTNDAVKILKVFM